jgi:hypothetical protein
MRIGLQGSGRRPTAILAAKRIAFRLQSNIETTGYRSLKEGEEVEFDLVVADDGKKKAFRVTGPDGAPPQVGLNHTQGLGRDSCRQHSCRQANIAVIGCAMLRNESQPCPDEA